MVQINTCAQQFQVSDGTEQHMCSTIPTFRWYRVTPVLKTSSSIPTRWGISESSTTPRPDLRKPRAFCSCNIFCVSRHFSVHSSVSTFSCASFWCNCANTWGWASSACNAKVTQYMYWNLVLITTNILLTVSLYSAHDIPSSEEKA